MKWKFTQPWARAGPSLSSRRAWIEMEKVLSLMSKDALSLSSRRAWIEISSSSDQRERSRVALLAEGVD